MTLHEEKKELRRAMRAACKAMPDGQRAAWSVAACQRVMKLPGYARAHCVLCYMALPHECDPAELIRDARKNGKRVAFPVCEADFALGLYVPEDENAFIVGKYGIREPDLTRAARIQPAEVDCMIIPGVAFDPACNRLGQGAGYYDRLLQSADAYKIGLAFPAQIVARVPVDALDRPMDAVACAGEVYLHTGQTGCAGVHSVTDR